MSENVWLGIIGIFMATIAVVQLSVTLFATYKQQQQRFDQKQAQDKAEDDRQRDAEDRERDIEARKEVKRAAEEVKRIVEEKANVDVEQARVNAEKLEAVKVALEKAQTESAKKAEELSIEVKASRDTVDKVHVLVNSSMSVQLKVSAVALRRVASYSRASGDANADDDDRAAALAESAYHDHEAKQQIVDRGQTIT